MDAKHGQDGDEAGGRNKRPGRKPGSPKIALNLRLDEEVYTQLKVHALLSKSTASDIVSDLVRKYLKVYTVTGPTSGEMDGAA